jgi:hypothetical protein
MERDADFDIAGLYAALEERRAARHLSWAQAALEIGGISQSTLQELGQRPAAEGDGVLQILRWLGRTPESFVTGCDIGGGVLPNAAAGVLRFDTRAIYAALEARRVERKLSWEDVARVIGVDAASLKRLSKGGRTQFPRIMRIMRWLRLPAATFAHLRPR